MTNGCKVHIHVSANRRGDWHYECADCPEFFGDTLSQDVAIQHSLDHYHLYHPSAVMAFQTL